MGNKTKLSGGVVDVLIVAKASRFRDGLKVVVQALTWVERVGVVDGWTAVFDYIQQYQPAIVIFDVDNLGEIPLGAVERLRVFCQDTKCLVIIDRAQQREVAHAMGADAMLLRGFTTELLYQTMRTLIVAYDPAVPVTGSLNAQRL